jgi:hypothetical protein
VFDYCRTSQEAEASQEEIFEKDYEQKKKVSALWPPNRQAGVRNREKRVLRLNSARDVVQPTCTGRRVCLSSGHSGTAKIAVTMER